MLHVQQTKGPEQELKGSDNGTGISKNGQRNATAYDSDPGLYYIQSKQVNLSGSCILLLLVSCFVKKHLF